MSTMPIDLSTVNWVFVGLMAVFAFVAALLGSLIAFRSRFFGAIIAGILFAIIFVFWNHYPHPQLQLPIVNTYTTPHS
jgi:fructose-specific phosphotransferase system IIC component